MPPPLEPLPLSDPLAAPSQARERPITHPHRLLRPAFPFDPARSPFFYGWVVVAASVLGIVASIPGQTMGVSVFTDHLVAALSLTRLELANAYLVGTLAASALLPLGGRLLDRFGARVTVIASCLLLGLTLAFLSVSDRIAAGISAGLGMTNASVVGFGVLVVAFTLLRTSGQGMLTMASRNMLAKWFDRRRGFAAGVASVFKSFAFGAAPLALAFLVAGLGWRGAWVGLALAIGFGMSLVGWLLFRDNPEECGLEMDGGEISASDASEEPKDARRAATVDFTRASALRTLGFWSVTLALSAHALVVTGITFHIVSIGSQVGLDTRASVAIFLPFAVASTLTGALVGITSDRVRIKHLLAFMMIAQAIGLVAMTSFGTLPGRTLAILGLGMSGGCFAVLSTVALPRFFGRAHLGAISGVQMSSMVIGSALGPSVLAFAHATTGSYSSGLLACLALPGIVLVLAPFTRNPQETLPAGGVELLDAGAR